METETNLLKGLRNWVEICLKTKLDTPLDLYDALKLMKILEPMYNPSYQ
jgi:hypothetical protein